MRCASLPAVGMMVRVACVALMVAACGTESSLDYGKDTTPEIPSDGRRLHLGLHPEVTRNESYVTRNESYNDAPSGTQKEQIRSLKEEQIRSFKEGQKWSFKN